MPRCRDGRRAATGRRTVPPLRAGTAKAHGEALGTEEIKLTRAAIGWTSEPFVIPEAAYSLWDARRQGLADDTKWVDAFVAYA